MGPYGERRASEEKMTGSGKGDELPLSRLDSLVCLFCFVLFVLFFAAFFRSLPPIKSVEQASKIMDISNVP